MGTLAKCGLRFFYMESFIKFSAISKWREKTSDLICNVWPANGAKSDFN